MKRTLLLLAFVLFYSQSFCQELSSLDRRLFVAVSGYELNEAEAKNLLAKGANINAVNGAMGGETFLINDIKSFKEPKFIKFLLDNGADPNIKDESGKTALDWALQYNMGRNRDGKEIIKLLQTAMKMAPTANETNNNNQVAVTKTTPANNQRQTTTKIKVPTSKTGPPSAAEVKQTIEKSFTGIYQSHFFGIKNIVTFQWSGGITVGKIQTVNSAPEACYPVKLKVRVTAQDPRDGNTSVSDRGQDAKIGGFLKNEIFCFYRDGFGEWTYGIYEQ